MMDAHLQIAMLAALKEILETTPHRDALDPRALGYVPQLAAHVWSVLIKYSASRADIEYDDDDVKAMVELAMRRAAALLDETKVIASATD